MKIAPVFAIALALAAANAPAQSSLDPELARRSQETQTKMRKVDLLIHIMPLVLRKDQFAVLMPAIEKARSQMRKVLQMEDEKIVGLDPMIDKALKDAFERGIYPTREMMNEAYKTTTVLAKSRIIQRDLIAQDMLDVVNKVLDAGQKKTAANSLDAAALDPSVKIDEKSDEEKIRFFTRWVFLDPLAYDVMLELEKRAQNPSTPAPAGNPG